MRSARRRKLEVPTPLSDPGESTHDSAPSTSTGDCSLRPPEKGSALPTSPQAVSRGAQSFGASRFASTTTCRVARLPDGSTRVAPSHGDFYVRASDGSITLPAAGYDYGGGWAPPPAGLPPAGTSASLAAPQVPGQPLPPCHALDPGGASAPRSADSLRRALWFRLPRAKPRRPPPR